MASSIIHDPTPGPSGDAEHRPTGMIQGHIDYAANHGAAIAYSKHTVINLAYNYYVPDPPKSVPAPADIELEGDGPIAEKPALDQAVFAFQSKTPEINGEAVNCHIPTQNEKDSALVSFSPEMERHLELLSRVIEEASPSLMAESYPPPLGTLPVNPPQSVAGNLTLEEDLRMLSPKMQNYLTSLGGNQEGTLIDDLANFYLSSGTYCDNFDVTSLLGPFAKDLQGLSPDMQQYITTLIVNPSPVEG